MSKLHLGFSPDGTAIELNEQALIRHTVVMGSSGSGKTAACKAYVEECVRLGIPVIAVDPQGDLASLGLVGDHREVERHGIPASTSVDYFSKLDLKVWTPGSTAGIPISMSPAIYTDGLPAGEEKIRAFGGIAASIAALAGYDSNSDAGQAAIVAFSMILEYADENKLDVSSVNDVVDFLVHTPNKLIERLAPVFSSKDCSTAARKLKVRTSGSNRLLFELGYPIDVDVLLGYEKGGAKDHGKTRVSVIYLNTLHSQEEKEMFVATLAHALYARMIQQPSNVPQAMFYLDEAAPFIPPVNQRRPVCKSALVMLLRQARKYGVGCLLATQSPGDLDYKALGQVGTWLLGKMSQRQEAEKVRPMLVAQPGDEEDVGNIVELLPNLTAGRFIMTSPDNLAMPTEVQMRWLVSKHQTLDSSRVESITRQADRSLYGGL